MGNDSDIRAIRHDLSNLVGLILGNVDFALEDLPPDHPATESLLEIQRAARSLRTLSERISGTLTDSSVKTLAPSPPLPRMRFLLIDDDDMYRALSERTLRRLNQEVTSFPSPPQALAAFQASPTSYDILITDLNLPGTTGIAVAAAFLKVSPSLRICLVTGELPEKLLIEAAREGVPLRYASKKPTTTGEFAKMLETLISRNSD